MTQDKKYTKSEFISAIKEKYPQYADVEDDVLYDKILEKYPIYKDQISDEVDVLKKKEEVESPFSFEKPESASKKDLTSSDIPAKSVDYWDEGVKKFDAAALRAKGAIARVPLFMNELVFSMILSDEDKEKLNSLSKEERENVLSTFPSTPGSPGFGMIAKEGLDYFNETKKQAETIEDTLAKFDTSITEDIGDLELGQAAGRLFSEAIGAVPSMMQAMIPYVGLVSTALGSAASKSEELQASGEDFGFATTSNALISGVAEGATEAVTKGIGSKVFKSLAGKSKDFVVKSTKQMLTSIAKDMGAEGASEDISLFVSKLADSWISGKEDAFNDSLLEFTDTFLIGAVSAGPLGGLGAGARSVRQAAKKRTLDKEAKNKNYTSITDAFRTSNVQEIDESQIKIAQTKDSRAYVKFDVDKQVNGGVITKQQGEEILSNFDQVSKAAKEIDGLNLNEEQSKKAVNLIKEKKALEDVIDGKDENLVKKQKERINQINDELSRVQEDVVAEEAVAEEKAPEPTVDQAEKKEPLKPLRFSINKSTEVEVDESGKFVGAFNKKTGEQLKTRASLSKAQNELIAQKDYTTGKSAFEGVPVGQEIANESEFVANESQNPKEIAQEYLKEKQSPESIDPVVEAFVGKYKVDKKSLRDYYKSDDELKDVVSYTIKKRGEIASPLDSIAQEVSETVGREVSPQELFDIMTDPKYKSNRIPKQSQTLIALRNKFIEVTGLLGTDQQIESVANQDPSKLKPVTEPVEVLEERAKRETELEIEEAVSEREAKAREEAKVEEPKTEGIAKRIFEGFKKAKDYMAKKAVEHFSAQGFQPDIIYKERQKKDANVRVYQTRIDRTLKQVKRPLKNVPKDRRDSVMKEFDGVFRGEIDPDKSTLSVELLAAAKSMRNQIDGLSNMLIESGYFDAADGIEAVQANIGKYVNRSYRLFTDSNWPSKVSEEVKENARRFFRREAVLKSRDIQRKITKLSENNVDGVNDNKIEDLRRELDQLSSEQTIEQKVNEILNKAEDNKYVVRGRDGKIDKNILKRRKDVPAELRALMGEVTNPLENYQNTVLKLAMLVFNYKFQRKIAEAGRNTFFTDGPTKENTVQIAKEGNEVYPELAGLWTTPEIAETFKLPEPMWKWYDAFTRFSGAIKWNKTVGSIATHAKNIFGNHGFVLMNGHLDWNEFKNSADLVVKEFLGKTSKEQQAYLDELISLGIVKQSATMGDLRTIFTDKSFEEAYKRTVIDQARNVASGRQKAAEFFRNTRVGKMTKQVVDRLNDAYQSEDDFFKIMAFGIEKQRYAKALYNKNKGDLTPAEAKIVNDRVSEIVKNTYPTYDRVPPIIKRLGRSPFLGAFVSFRAESIRTAFNTYAIALNEIKSENKEVRKIGAKRLTSASVYTGVKLAIAAQISLAAKSLVYGGDDESEEYDDLRRFLPSWSEDSVISIIEKGPGNYTYMDLSANDPHAFFSELIVAGANEEDALNIFYEKIKTIYEPFVGKDLLFAFTTEFISNKKSSGAPVYEVGDDLIDQARSVLEHATKMLEPGTISTIRRISKAATDEDKSLLNEFIGAFTGYRPIDADIKLSYTFRARDLREDVTQQVRKYNRARYDEKLSEQEVSKIYDEVNEEYARIIKKASDYTSSAIRLGVDSKDIIATLKKQGFSKRDISYILSGKEYTYIPSKKRR